MRIASFEEKILTCPLLVSTRLEGCERGGPVVYEEVAGRERKGININIVV